MKVVAELDWTPGVETEPLPNLRIKSILLALMASFGLFACYLYLNLSDQKNGWFVLLKFTLTLHHRRRSQRWKKR